MINKQITFPEGHDDRYSVRYRQLSFISYMQGVIVRLRLMQRIGTAENYTYSLNSFMKFLQAQGLDDCAMISINQPLIEDYQAWLRSNSVCSNSSSFYIRNLRAVYNRAVAEGLITDCNPFRKTYTGVDKTKKRAITLEEIRRIKDLDLSATPRLIFSRDVFLFCFYAMGISFIDAAMLKNSNLRGNDIVYRRHKTGQEIVVPINKHIQEIIVRYHDPTSQYLLPIINSNDKNMRRQYRTTLHRINNHLKLIGRIAGVPTPLTTYVSRHAWASIARDKGIDIATISDALGHDNIKTTEIYLTSISSERLANANNIILSDL